MSPVRSIKALRGRLLWFVDDPWLMGDAAHRYIEDGMLVIADGLVASP